MVIDNSFASDSDLWMFPAYATRPVVIAKGTRICQFRIQKKQPAIDFIPVEHLTASKRGSFGSTGI